jgi:MFS family permease
MSSTWRMSSAGSWLPGLRESLPEGSVGLRFAVMAMVDSVGTGAFLAVSVVFVTRSVHLSSASLGLGLTLSAAIAVGTAIPIGILADKVGPRRVLVGVSLWRAACFVAYPLVQNLWQFLTVVCLLGVVEKAAGPMQQALVGQAVPAVQRVRMIAVLRSIRNVGMTVGALLGMVGLLIGTRAGYAAILLANALSFALLATLAARVPLLVETSTAGPHPRFAAAVLRDGPFLAFAAVNAVLTVHMTLLSIGLPLWVVGHSRVSPAIISPLLAVNTVMAVALQVRASRETDTMPAATRALRRAGLALAACCLLFTAVPRLPVVPAAGLLVLAMVALTAGELLQSAGGWAGSYLLAMPGQEGVYLSFFGLRVSLQQIAAPVVLTRVADAGARGWVALAAVLGGCGLVAPAIGRWAQVRATTRAAPAPAT